MLHKKEEASQSKVKINFLVPFSGVNLINVFLKKLILDFSFEICYVAATIITKTSFSLQKKVDYILLNVLGARHILTTELRTKFVPHMEKLFDEDILLGKGKFILLIVTGSF